MTPDVIRVFSMAPEELAGSTPDDARDKFVLAARERNDRILYVRPFLTTTAGVGEMQTNLDYVASISDELTRAGYKLDKAVPMPVLSTPAPLFGLAALGTLAATAIAVGDVSAALSRPVSGPLAPPRRRARRSSSRWPCSRCITSRCGARGSRSWPPSRSRRSR